jgi:uncharacterized protein GlcG (DUF336 family)
MKRLLASVFSAAVLAAYPGLAQVISTPGAPASPAAPIEIPADKRIPLDQALKAVQAAQSACSSQGATNTVEVVDLNNNIKVLLASDGAVNASFEYARKKAYTVLKKGMASGAFGKTLGQLPRGAVIEGDPNLIQYAGAVPIMKGDALIGAVSVSSSKGQLDEACALAGLAEFHF